MSLRVYIEPLSTVFFRDNRPFDAGVNVFADTVIPSPLVMFSVIGSYYLNKQGISMKDFISNGNVKLGSYDPDIANSKLKIKGPFFKYGDQIFFPPPSNLWGSGKTTNHILKPKNGINPQWDISSPDLRPLEIPRYECGTQPEPINNYISLEAVEQYITGNEIKDFEIYSRNEEEFFIKEDRYGHELDFNSMTVKEGQLYISRHLRFTELFEYSEIKKTAFMVCVEGIDKTDFDESITAVGGEGKIARIYAEETGNKLVPDNEAILNEIKQRKQFFLYFITPTVFKNGWCGWNSDLDGAKMVGACVNKPIFISGWQKSGIGSKGKPRPLFKAIPAGSVYFFESPEWDDKKLDDFYKKYHCNESLSDYYPCAGFGTAIIGVW